MTTNSYPSPDGRFILEICPVPMRMSHEVDVPYLVDSQTKQGLFDPGSLWDASGVVWSDDSKMLTMHMLHYSNGLHGFTLSLDLENMTADLQFSGNSIFSGTIAAVQQSMERVAHLGPLIKPYL